MRISRWLGRRAADQGLSRLPVRGRSRMGGTQRGRLRAREAGGTESATREARSTYAGGVFSSAPLLARFRMLVELEDGNRVSAPESGAAEGALLEAVGIGGKSGLGSKP